jgi:ferric-dicitrate binding protein FerR (iron transport regulator)
LRTDTMKRRHLAVLAALWLAVAGAAIAHAQERVGTVTGLEGQADVLHPGASAWAPLRAGDPVALGDQLRTRTDSKLRVTLREDSVLTLAPASQLAITEQVVAPATVSRFQLLLGTIKAAVTERYSEPNARFEVETPTAIAGVRGTSFLASYDPSQEETLVVGLIDVTHVRALVDTRGTAVVDLGPGLATRVRRGSRPLAPAPLPEDQLRSLQSATELGGRAGYGANRIDARRPQRPGERAMSTEEQAVDQPLLTPGSPKPPPPPPPVPRVRP